MATCRLLRLRIAVVAGIALLWAGSAAAASKQTQLGRCASFVKRLQANGSAAGITRDDLYEGLTGWIAMKAGANPGDIDSLAVGATADAEACRDFGLAPEPLRALEKTIAKVPAAKLRASVEGCLAALRLLDGLAARPGLEPVLGLLRIQMTSVGRLLGYVPREQRPGPGAVEARKEGLVLEAGRDPWGSPSFARAFDGCETLGVDTDRLRRTQGVL